MWALGWVGRAQCTGRGAETRDLLRSIYREKGVGDGQPRDGSGTRAAKQVSASSTEEEDSWGR